MKKISFILFLITAAILGINAQGSGRFCDFGVTFEISNNPGWGYGEPVILTVQPFSPADKAGLKIGDIVMEVNGVATYLRNNQTISNWFADTATPEIRLTVRNVDTYFQEYKIFRDCKPSNSISEFNLATAHSFYSIEDTNQRAFSLPLRVDPNLNVDFTDYHTFDFINEGDVPAVDHYINSQLEKAMIARGLKRSTTDPDIIVQSYYTYQPNVKFDATTNSRNMRTWRYDTEAKQMIAMPILSAEDPNAESKGQYVLELGVRFFDKKFIDTTKLTQIWDCKSREFLTEQLDLQEYTRVHAPLMLMQFPYSAPKTIAKYLVSVKGFNYTGLNFNMNDLKTISYVDQGSPAQQAGLRVGDIVSKIDNVKFDYTPEELESGYRRFLVETMALRDKRTRFIDANGFPDCMYWDKNRYAEVAAAFKKEAIYAPAFSYLYSFEKYVSGLSSPKSLSIEVKSSMDEKRTVSVMPQIQRSTTVRAL